MPSKSKTTTEYINTLCEDRKIGIQKLRDHILKNIPKGFYKKMSYGMIGFVVPYQIYPNGYHCNPKLPLPFINIPPQKSLINIYHYGYLYKTQFIFLVYF